MINNIWLCISSGVVKQLESLIWKHLPKAFWPPALPWNLPTTCPGNLFWKLPETSPEPYQNSGKCEVCPIWKVSICWKTAAATMLQVATKPPPSASFLVFLLPDDAVASCALIAVSAVYLHSWQNAFPMSIPQRGANYGDCWLLTGHWEIIKKTLDEWSVFARPRQPHVSLVLLAKQLHPVQDLSGCWFENKPWPLSICISSTLLAYPSQFASCHAISQDSKHGEYHLTTRRPDKSHLILGTRVACVQRCRHYPCRPLKSILFNKFESVLNDKF